MNALTIGTVSFISLKIVYGMANEDEEVIGINNVNDYYNINMRFYRLTCCREASYRPMESIAELGQNIHQGITQ